MEEDVGNREKPVELCVVELVRPFQSHRSSSQPVGFNPFILHKMFTL